MRNSAAHKPAANPNHPHSLPVIVPPLHQFALPRSRTAFALPVSTPPASRRRRTHRNVSPCKTHQRGAASLAYTPPLPSALCRVRNAPRPLGNLIGSRSRGEVKSSPLHTQKDNWTGRTRPQRWKSPARLLQRRCLVCVYVCVCVCGVGAGGPVCFHTQKGVHNDVRSWRSALQAQVGRRPPPQFHVERAL